MIKLMILVIAVWLLWGYNLLPSFSFFNAAVSSFLESIANSNTRIILSNCEDKVPEKRRKRW